MAAVNKKPEMVDHPDHYNHGNYETADILDDWFPTDPHVWTAAKYLSRYMHKDNPIQDLEKGIWYIKRRINVLENEKDENTE